jgi:DNA polymerase-3 subunit epsilon
MTRCVVLDTETTGLDPKQGHRLIEVGCVELVDYLPTGKQFHCLVYPDREIDADAERVHGISLDSLKGKPRFHEPEICDALMTFIGDDPIVAHNAAFDRSFINNELVLAGRAPPPVSQWIDSVALARKKLPGAAYSLDALCRRFKISLEGREKHGALIDAQLLAAVYLELHGGRERKLELESQRVEVVPVSPSEARSHGQRSKPVPSQLTAEENLNHQAFLRKLGPESVWAKILTLD